MPSAGKVTVLPELFTPFWILRELTVDLDIRDSPVWFPRNRAATTKLAPMSALQSYYWNPKNAPFRHYGGINHFLQIWA